MFMSKQEEAIKFDVMIRYTNTNCLTFKFNSVVELNDDADEKLLFVVLFVFAWFLMLYYK